MTGRKESEMLSEKDLRAQQAHCRDLAREAEQDRLTLGALREAGEGNKEYSLADGLRLLALRRRAGLALAGALLVFLLAIQVLLQALANAAVPAH